jgi:peptide deformylase
VEGSHLLARALQHENDHLDGVLFVDRLDAEARAAALEVLREAAWNGEQAYLPAGEPVPPPPVPPVVAPPVPPVVKVSPH